MAYKVAVATANNMVASQATLAGTSAKIIIYSGTRPATPDTALSGNTVLATVTVPSWGTAASGSSAAASMTAVTAAASGTATFFRLYKSDGTTTIGDGDITATGGGGVMTFDNTSFVSGGTVTVTSFSLTVTAD